MTMSTRSATIPQRGAEGVDKLRGQVVDKSDGIDKQRLRLPSGKTGASWGQGCRKAVCVWTPAFVILLKRGLARVCIAYERDKRDFVLPACGGRRGRAVSRFLP